MLSKNNKKTVLVTLVLITLSLSIASLITISAPNYTSAQVSGQNATITDGDAATPTDVNATNITAGENQSTSEVKMLIEQARMALQNNDTQGALMNLNSALNALEGVGGGGGEQNNMTTPQNEITDGTTTEAGTIGSGGAGGAGTAGGIMTGDGTGTDNSTS